MRSTKSKCSEVNYSGYTFAVIWYGLTINGIVYDIGFPGWMTDLVPKESERSVRPKLTRRANSMKRERDARMQNLSPGWWLKSRWSDVLAMETIGPVAYRGRAQQIQRKSGRAAKPLGRRAPKKSCLQPRSQRNSSQHNSFETMVLLGKAVSKVVEIFGQT